MLLWDFLPVCNLVWKLARFPPPASTLLDALKMTAVKTNQQKYVCGALNGLGV